MTLHGTQAIEDNYPRGYEGRSPTPLLIIPGCLRRKLVITGMQPCQHLYFTPPNSVSVHVCVIVCVHIHVSVHRV